MSLVTVQDKRLCPVPITGVFTIPSEDALVSCNCPGPCKGISLPNIPLHARAFQLHAYEMKDKLIERQKVRGRDFVSLSFHGPFPSFDFNNNLTDIKASLWNDAVRKDQNGDEHPEEALVAVFEVDDAFSPYSDYQFRAMFLGYEYVTRQSDRGGLPLL